MEPTANPRLLIDSPWRPWGWGETTCTRVPREGPRAEGWDIEIEHSVKRVDHLSDVQRRRVARVVQVLTDLSGIAMRARPT